MANRPPPVPGERRALKRQENEKEGEKNETGVLGEIAFIHQSFYTN